MSKPCPKCGRPMAEETMFRGLWTCPRYATMISKNPLKFRCDGFELTNEGAQALVDYLMSNWMTGTLCQTTSE